MYGNNSQGKLISSGAAKPLHRAHRTFLWGVVRVVRACMCAHISHKCAALAPPVDSYGPLPVHGAAEREGHSQISLLLPAESAAPLPHHGRQRTETTTTTTCARWAPAPRPTPAARVVPSSPRPTQGELNRTQHERGPLLFVCFFFKQRSVHDPAPRAPPLARSPRPG